MKKPIATISLLSVAAMAMILDNVIASRGALPIKAGDDTIGAAGASGAPGGDKDEVCIQAGLDKIADQLR